MQTIKKYANRKLYHTNRKQYITLDGIAALIQAGDPVQVLDNETGEDITAQILTQVVLQTRSGGDRLPTQVLTGLIQAGGDTIAGVRRSFWSAIGGTSVVDSEIKPAAGAAARRWPDRRGRAGATARSAAAPPAR